MIHVARLARRRPPWRRGHCRGVIPFASLIVAIQAQTRSSERAAAAWMQQFPGQIEVDPSSRNYLLLVKGLDGFPTGEAASLC